MNCEEVQLLLIEYVDNNLPEAKRLEVEGHLDSCEKCRQEEKEIRELFQAMDDSPLEEPGASLRRGFDQMLQSELNIVAQERRGGQEADGGRTISIRRISTVWAALAAFVLLVVGVFIGTRITYTHEGAATTQLSELKSEVKDMKQTLMFTLLKEESASDRIKAVNYAKEMSNPDQQVIGALISTLNHDKNVNVRLASLYSLAKFSDIQAVRDSLVSSLPKQAEPIIQIVMINLLTENKESKAVKPIEEILSNRNTLPAVKDIARKGLKTL